MTISKKLLVLTLPALLLIGCTTSNNGENTESSLPNESIVANTPINNLSDVVVCFDQIIIEGLTNNVVFTVGGETGAIPSNDLCLDDDNQVIPNTAGINLLDFTGIVSMTILKSIAIPDGQYSQLSISIGKGSYALSRNSQNKLPVLVAANELQLDGFTVGLVGAVNFSLEFDIEKALSASVDKKSYVLKTRGLRLVDNS